MKQGIIDVAPYVNLPSIGSVTLTKELFNTYSIIAIFFISDCFPLSSA